MGSRQFSLQVSGPCKTLLNCKSGVTTAWTVCRVICVPAEDAISCGAAMCCYL